MINFLKNNWKIFLVFALAFLIFYPSLFVFYTNDDFFFLSISKAENLTGFLHFFDILKGPEGFGMYRPLATQVFYSLAWSLFNLNPIGLHVISFLVFFAVIYLVYKLAEVLFPSTINHKQSLAGYAGKSIITNRMPLFAAFLYAVSATHFAHLYYLATFQELAMTFFVLLTILMFIKFLNRRKYIHYFLSLIFFLLALMSKETAVIAPLLIGLVYWYQKSGGVKLPGPKKFIKFLLPFFLILISYILIRVLFYGFATGDSYIWNFSIRKLANTLMWYVLWSFNLPETLVDFIGPGLRLNPNLFLYWSDQMKPIFILFGLELLFIIYFMVKGIFIRDAKFIEENNKNSLFSVIWFVVSLVPVMFLPFHKFTFFLTLPLLGTVFRISHLVAKTKVSTFLLIPFALVWTSLSVLSINHTVNTNWITKGQEVSKKTYDFLNEKYAIIDRDIVFADTINDSDLPWSPTSVVRTALSDQNFFKVFYPEFSYNIYYGADSDTTHENSYIILSRTLLGY